MSDRVFLIWHVHHVAPFLIPNQRDGNGRSSPRGRWMGRFRRTGHECSDGFRTALEPLTDTFQRVGRRGRKRHVSIRRTNFSPEHIPEQLQDDWFDQHFRHVHGIRPRLLRRGAALRLVQMSAGGSLADAAAFLGIHHRYSTAESGTAFATAAYWTAEAGPAEFRLAVHALAEQLDATPDLIDYQRRREALRTWCLAPADWQRIVEQLPRTKGPFQPELGDCKRQFASEAVWTRITQGEHVLAPRIIEDQRSCEDATWHKRRNSDPLQPIAGPCDR